ncbi:TatD family hydrolase [Shewanella marina]|uniref:TatD family hydrolase n=1 Tax=Shewanella marina TaxID=487319 RepID=UPI00046EF4D3|nr:TatD family hydrolase [Shewanella marina]
MKLFDTHAHLDFTEFDIDRAELLLQMQQHGISGCLLPAVSPRHWLKQLAVAKQYQQYFALGIHPWFCPDDLSQALAALTEICQLERDNRYFIAIGEAGLDKLSQTNYQLQLQYLTAQIVLAKQLQLPIILHCVRAHADMIAILTEANLPQAGVIHGFSGSIEVARQYIKLGFKLGIGGLVCEANAKKLRHCVQELPLTSFVMETDSPAMTPKQLGYDRNTPMTLVTVIDEIAQLRQETVLAVSRQLMKNCRMLFSIDLI